MAGQSILRLLHKAANVAEENGRHAVDAAQKLSHQLRAAQDRIAELEGPSGGFSGPSGESGAMAPQGLYGNRRPPFAAKEVRPQLVRGRCRCRRIGSRRTQLPATAGLFKRSAVGGAFSCLPRSLPGGLFERLGDSGKRVGWNDLLIGDMSQPW